MAKVATKILKIRKKIAIPQAVFFGKINRN